jgi:hypothetical protein
MKQLFLSYARADGRKAKRLLNELRRKVSIDVWFDRENISPGERWDPVIRKAIRESDYFLAVLSRDSVSKRGFRHTELREALEVAKEFPDDWIFLIPTRLDDCKMPVAAAEQFSYLDLFPKWGNGVAQLCRAIKTQESRGRISAPVDTLPDLRRTIAAVPTQRKGEPIKVFPNKPVRRARASGAPKRDSHYKVVLVDLDERIPTIRRIVRGLNSVQSAFHFTSKRLAIPRQALTTEKHRPHLDVPRLPGSFYERIGPLETDNVICLTRRLLKVEDENYEYSNYLADQSPVDPRVFFISHAGLDEYAREAGVTLDTAMAYLITGELVNHFLDIVPAKGVRTKPGVSHRIPSYHKQTRNCPMDFAEDHSVLVGGLRAGRFCRFCSRTLDKNKPFAETFRAMIAWGRKGH